MSKTMLIDAAHPEETRVAIVDGRKIEEFDFESRAKRQLRGNIYLAKVTRVEPSLQAAFIEYGGNRHGFLAFNEIHPDYYQIPVADREAIMAEAHDDEDEDDLDRESTGDDVDPESALADEERLKRRLMRRYKIQDVIKRRQILLVQVVKEERGTKGAALTTYLSLAGRYCVLMPNTARGGGISRKITSAEDRKKLREIAEELGCDYLVYQEIDDLKAAILEGAPDVEDLDMSCFDGRYVTGIVSEEYLAWVEGTQES